MSKAYKYPLSENQRVVFITGCGSGLGLALAKLFYHKTQFRVVATARSEESITLLRNLLAENQRFQIHKLDITNHQARETLIANVFRQWKSIDVLINNAGVAYRSVIEHMDEKSELAQLDINYLSPLALIRLVIPAMRERGFGQIINISSVSGMVAMPTMASYSASKHALEGATEALWYELRPFGIKVSLIQPGFIHSSSFTKVPLSRKADLSKALAGPYAEYYNSMEPFIEQLMNYSRSTPEMIAKKILQLVRKENPPLWNPVTGDALLFFLLRKYLPRSLFHKLMFYLLPNTKNWGLDQSQKFTKPQIVGSQ